MLLSSIGHFSCLCLPGISMKRLFSDKVNSIMREANKSVTVQVVVKYKILIQFF